MATVTVPAKTSDSLGAALSNVRTPQANELSAVHVERIKDALIDHANAINTNAGPRTPGVISGTTYTVQPADHGQVYACENAAGCTVTVPDDLPPGTQVGFYGTQDVVVFSGAALGAVPATFLLETAEAYSFAMIHVSDDPATVLLTGDLAPA